LKSWLAEVWGMSALVEQDIRGVVQVAQRSRRAGKGHPGNLAFERGGEAAGVRAGSGCRRRLPQDQHRLFLPAAPHVADVAILRGVAGKSLRSESLGRHSHPERCTRHAGSGRHPNRRQRQRRHPGASITAGTERGNHAQSDQLPCSRTCPNRR